MFEVKVTEGSQGVHHFFTASVPWGQLAPYLVPLEEMKTLALDEETRMQRAVATSRLGQLERYLVNEANHFFSALTLIVLPPDLDQEARPWANDAEEWDYFFKPDPQDGPVLQRTGTFKLGEARLFPADGQHRAYATIRALREKRELSREDIAVVLIPYKDRLQVQQLFTDLNKNAKPASRSISIAFDRRDPVASIARAIGDRIPLFQGRVNTLTNSLSETSRAVIALNTLNAGTEKVLDGLVTIGVTEEDDAKRKQTISSRRQDFLSEANRDESVEQVAEAWQMIIDCFPQWKKVQLDETPPGELRKSYLYPHGLGWLGLTEAAKRLMQKYGEDWASHLETAVEALNWSREAPIWSGNAVIPSDDPDKPGRVNNTGPAVNDLADKIVSAAN